MLQFRRLKLQVTYPDGVHHVIELTNDVNTLGRDPASDLVLYDTQCSRRHAVLETTSQGVFVRDAGSANGTYVNGRRTERKQLVVGDVLRLGDIALKLLPGDTPLTIAGDAAVPPPADYEPSTSDTDQRVALREAPRLAARVLGLGWLAFAAVFAGLGAAAALLAPVPQTRYGLLFAGLAFAIWALVLGFGWLRGASWARPAQCASSVLGVFFCPLSLAALLGFAFAMRADTARMLRGEYVPGPDFAASEASDRRWALGLGAALLACGLALCVGAVYALMHAATLLDG